MLHTNCLILLLGLSFAARADLNLFDEETPWRPLKKEHALFYSAVWTAIGLGFGHGIYQLAKTLKKPTDSDAIMNDAICALAIALFAKMVHHSANEVLEGLQLYFDKNEQEAAV